MASLLARWQQYTGELKDWLAGAADGGPNGDGKYPLTNAVGTTYYVACPAAQEARVSTSADSAGVHEDGAVAAAGAAEVALQGALAAQLQADTFADLANQAQLLAQTYADTAGSHAANALVHRNAAAAAAQAAAASMTGASTASVDAVAAKDAAELARGQAAASAASASASAQAAAVFDPSLYRLKSVSITWSDLAGVPVTFAPATHPHVISDVTGLQAALDAKQATLAYVPVNKAGDDVGPLTVSSRTEQIRIGGGENISNTNRDIGVIHNKTSGNLGIYDFLNSEWLLRFDSINTLYLNSPIVRQDVRVGVENAYRWYSDDVLRAMVGVSGGSGQIIAGGNTNDMCIRAESGVIRFGAGATVMYAMSPTQFRPSPTGAVDLGSTALRWATCYATNVDVTGNLVASGILNVGSGVHSIGVAGQLRSSSASHLVISTASAATIYFRPNGDTSTAGQVTLDSAGKLAVGGNEVLHLGNSARVVVSSTDPGGANGTICVKP
jgi:hypothetical protein